jgi:DNA-binding transcriptional LysR family regulator
MNLHHLEIFYYVARHGGISAAVRHMPYGIQQPAVSGQMLALEQDLGVKLFHRQPFRLTPEGEELLAFVRPFFDNLESVGARLRKRLAPPVRIGASEIFLRDALPVVIERVQQVHPEIRLRLRSGFQRDLESWLEHGDVDLAIIPLRGRRPPRCGIQRLLKLPLVLLVPRNAKVKSAAELWASPKLLAPLISLPATEWIPVLFQKGLKRRRIDWPTTIEASSMELVAEYVANGQGYGVHILTPAIRRNRRLRVLPLDGFEPMELVALWPGKPSAVVRTVIDEIHRYAQQVDPAAQAKPGAG